MMTATVAAEWLGRVYGEMRSATVAEAASRSRADAPTERHLQCVWYDPALRPGGLVTTEGEPVEVVSPGVWNLEAGPDFVGAAIRVGAGRRQLVGDVEIHLRASDWARHRHGEDPRYAGVRIHVTLVPPPRAVMPHGAVCIPFAEPLSRNPEFSWAGVDLTAYPYSARAQPAPCEQALRGWSPDEVERLLESAGAERLRQKAERICQRSELVGTNQALWEEVLAALGYKHNKGAARKLAQRVPLAELIAASEGDAESAAAILWGASGLLPEAGPMVATARRVWDRWWKFRARWCGRALTRADWRLDGVRPANRPERRLRAAAVWAVRSPLPAERWSAAVAAGPREFVRCVLRDLVIPDPAGEGGAAALGRSRAVAVLVNVAVPFAMSLGVPITGDPRWLRALPDEAPNAIERQMAYTLLGRDHPAAWCRGALRRQGLIQIFTDFCLRDRSHCEDCPFPAWLAAARSPNSARPESASA
ncbi:MAG: DUF2851 family protein [Kiritimatiellae bacterium]|nr:DUF2851 family protein [Kiritimatiellia bacterium]